MGDMQPAHMNVNFHCPYCGSNNQPVVRSVPSPGAYVLIVVAFFAGFFTCCATWMLIPFAIFFTSKVKYCSACHIKVGEAIF